MKKAINSYITFTRKERIGIACLCFIILVLIVVRATLVYWVRPYTDTKEEKKLQAAYAAFLRSQPKEQTVTGTSVDYTDKGDDESTPIPDMINLNTADSATLVRLKGIGPAFAHKIIQKRKKGYRFRKEEDILDIQYISDATFTIIKKHLSVGDSTQNGDIRRDIHKTK